MQSYHLVHSLSAEKARHTREKHTQGNTDNMDAPLLLPADVIQQDDHIPGHLARSTYQHQPVQMYDIVEK